MATKKRKTNNTEEARRRWDAEARRVDDYHEANVYLATTPEQRVAWMEKWESAKRQLGKRP